MDYSKLITPKEHHKILYDMIENVMGTFQRREILCWIEGGTLLGAVRDGGIIAHDDDIDLGVMLFDLEKVRKVTKKIATRYNYILDDTSQGLIKLIHPKVFNGKHPVVDIFILAHMTDGKVEPTNMNFINRWPDWWHHEDDFHELASYKFGRLNVLGPKNPIPHLNRRFPNWQTEIVIIDHRSNILCKFDLSEIKKCKEII